MYVYKNVCEANYINCGYICVHILIYLDALMYHSSEAIVCLIKSLLCIMYRAFQLFSFLNCMLKLCLFVEGLYALLINRALSEQHYYYHCYDTDFCHMTVIRSL